MIQGTANANEIISRIAMEIVSNLKPQLPHAQELVEAEDIALLLIDRLKRNGFVRLDHIGGVGE